MAGPTRLSVTLSPEGIRCTVVIAGTLDAVSTAAIDALYDQLVGAGFGEVVLELSGLDQIDEAGAVAIAQLWCHLREHGVCSHVCGLASKFMGSPIELLLAVRNSDAEQVCEFCRQGKGSRCGPTGCQLPG